MSVIDAGAQSHPISVSDIATTKQIRTQEWFLKNGLPSQNIPKMLYISSNGRSIKADEIFLIEFIQYKS